MRQPRITDEMFATVPALIARGLTKAEIAAQFGVMPSSLQVMCSQRRISLRKGGPLLKRLTLVYEELPLSDGVLKSLRGRAGDGQADRPAGQRSLGEDRQGRSLQGSAGRGGSACPVIDQDEVADQLENGQGDGDHGAEAAAWPRRQGDRA